MRAGKSGAGGVTAMTSSPVWMPAANPLRANARSTRPRPRSYVRSFAALPRARARALSRARSINAACGGPHGRPWGDTTIRGHAKKGTGILNNELYRGRLVWGRQRFIKDPATGRRVSRLNSAGSEVVVDVPHLRIIDDELWDAVKCRQAQVARPLTDPHVTTPLNDLHRPRFLLSGLLTCGVCGGGYTITAKDRYGCARRGSQGTCSNSRGIRPTGTRAAGPGRLEVVAGERGPRGRVHRRIPGRMEPPAGRAPRDRQPAGAKAC